MSGGKRPSAAQRLLGDVERATAGMPSREAWAAIRSIARARGVPGKDLGAFRAAVWRARSAANEAAAMPEIIEKVARMESNLDALRRRVELAKEHQGGQDRLAAIHSLRLRSEIVVAVDP